MSFARTLSEVDVIGFCVPADQRIGPGDRYIAAELASVAAPVVAIVTKVDVGKHCARGRPADGGQRARQSSPTSFRSPPSPATRWTCSPICSSRNSRPARCSTRPIVNTDEPVEISVAELVREAALDGVRDELPHSIAVTVDEMRPRDGRPDLTEVFATIHLERTSQKGILIGAGGSRLKAIGTAARPQIERLLGTRVHLDLHVAVESGLATGSTQARSPGPLGH